MLVSVTGLSNQILSIGLALADVGSQLQLMLKSFLLVKTSIL